MRRCAGLGTLLALAGLALGGCDFGYQIGELPDGSQRDAMVMPDGSPGVDGGGGCGAVTRRVLIRGLAFDPKHITVPVGTRVLWVNQDTTAHDVTQGNPGDPSPAFGSGQMAPGAEWSHDFCTAGVTVYNCSLHPTLMRDATVTVTP